MQVKWFGPKWAATITDECEEAPAPLGQACPWCEEPINRGDRGLLIWSEALWSGQLGYVPFHLECHLRQVIGPVGHQAKGLLHECDLQCADDPMLTTREAAQAAMRYWTEQQSKPWKVYTGGADTITRNADGGATCPCGMEFSFKVWLLTFWECPRCRRIFTVVPTIPPALALVSEKSN